jgi:hypothetical protein
MPAGRKSSNARQTYVRGVITDIGICSSVKSVKMSSYETVLDIIEQHPDANVKLEGVDDFCITKNGTGFTLWTLKNKEIIDRISYIQCAGKKISIAGSFNMCLRNSIVMQIRNFRNAHTLKICALCHIDLTEETGCDVDHVKHFSTMVSEFILMQPSFTYPVETKQYTEESVGRRLLDSGMEERFQQYHKQNAILRLTCTRCNNKRGGPVKKINDLKVCK